jgi:transcriptional regulator with XRE-family HTH domain
VEEARLKAAFGSVIRQLREDQGLSQEALSFAAGRHRTYVSLLERGRNSPSLATLWSLAAALKMPASEIVEKVERHLQERKRSRRA